MGQQHGVEPPVGDVEPAAQGVGQAVTQPQPGGVEGHARQVGGQQHIRLGLLAAAEGGGQALPGQNKGLLRQGVGVHVGPGGDIGLGGMGEHVHAGVRRHLGGHPGQKHRVQHRLVGQQCVVHQGVLHPLFAVGEYGEGGDLRAGTGGGGHRPEGDLPGGPQLFAVLHHGLGAVQGGAAPEGHHRLGLEVGQCPGPLCHHLQRRVGHHAGKGLHGAAGQPGLHLIQQAGLGQKVVGDHHHPPAGQLLQGGQGIRAKGDSGFQLESFHERSPVSSLMALVWRRRSGIYQKAAKEKLHHSFRICSQPVHHPPAKNGYDNTVRYK